MKTDALCPHCGKKSTDVPQGTPKESLLRYFRQNKARCDEQFERTGNQTMNRIKWTSWVRYLETGQDSHERV